jgi:hypothetical protein
MQRIGAWKATDSTKSFVQFLLPTSGYRDLYILSNLRTTNSSDKNVIVTFNGDPQSNNLYRTNYLAESQAGLTTTTGLGFRINSVTGNYFTEMEGFIPGFLLTTNVKQLLVKSGANVENILHLGVLEWNNTAALTTLRFSLNAGGAFGTGSTISLYAI